MTHFIITDRETDYLLLPSVDDWTRRRALSQGHIEKLEIQLKSGSAETAGVGRKSRSIGRTGWCQPARGNQAAGRPGGGDGHGQTQDCRAGRRALPMREDRVRREPYALRKQTVEPVFDIIKSVMGYRQFSVQEKTVKNINKILLPIF